MTTIATTFQFNFLDNHLVRAKLIDDAPWFVAADICKALGLSSPTKAILALDDDESTLNTIQGSHRPTNFVSESGMYALIFRSRKAIAKTFRKWVTSEVLPSIRERGGYGGHFADSRAAEPPLLESLPKTSRAGLHQSISQVVSTVAGASYPAVYRQLHSELGVNHLADMSLEQIQAAIEILKREYGARAAAGSVIVSDKALVGRTRLTSVLTYSLSLAEECMLIHGALRSLGYQRHGQFVGLAKEIQLVGGLLADEAGVEPKIMG